MRIASKALFVAALGMTCAAHAAEWWVSTTGSDATGTGAQAAPFRTISHVLDPANGIVNGGDIVTIRGPAGNNTYAECDIRLRVPLTLRSAPNETAHLHCDLATPDTVTVQIDPDASGSRLSRLEISGGFYYGVFLQTDWYTGGGEAEHGASDVIIEDCHIHDTGRDAIKVTPKSDRLIVRRNEIHHTGAIYPPGTPLDDENAEGIDNVNGSGMQVRDNYIHDTATTGVYFKGGAADVIIERNRIENAGGAGILIGFDTSPEFFDTAINPNYYEAVRGIVRNNVVRGTNYAGIGLYASQNAQVLNNTIVDSARLAHAALYFGVTFQDYEPQAGRPANVNPILRNNLVIQNRRACMGIRYSTELGGLSGLSGNVGSDYNWFHDTAGACGFIDGRPGSPIDEGGPFAQWQAHELADAHSREAAISVAADGHLLPGSAAIDQGLTLAAVSDDIDQQPRASGNDIGADERDEDGYFSHGFE